VKKTIRIRAGLAAIVAAVCASTFSAPAHAVDTPHMNWNFSIDSTSNAVAYDPAGHLWTWGWMTQGVTPESRVIELGPAPIQGFLVTKWNVDADGVPDLIVSESLLRLGGIRKWALCLMGCGGSRIPFLMATFQVCRRAET
jgi:hypothetical protein